MRDYRSSRPALMGPALGAFIAVLAVAGVLAFIVLNGGQNPDPVQPTPVGTAIAAPSGQNELALNPTPTPGATSTPDATTTPAALAVTPTPRAIKAPTSRPMPAPTATALPNVRVTPSPTASPTPLVTATPRPRATPRPVVLPAVSGGGVAERRQPTVAPVEAAVIEVEPVAVEPTIAYSPPIAQQPIVVPQQPVFDNSQSNSGADALATVLSGQGRPANNVPGFVPDSSSGQPAFDFPDFVVPTPSFPRSSVPRDSSGARDDLASAIRASNPAVRNTQRNQTPATAAANRTRAASSLGDDIRKRVLDAQKKQTPAKKQTDKDKRAKPGKPDNGQDGGSNNQREIVLPGGDDD